MRIKRDNMNVKDFVKFTYKYLNIVTVTMITVQGCWPFFSLYLLMAENTIPLGIRFQHRNSEWTHLAHSTMQW